MVFKIHLNTPEFLIKAIILLVYHTIIVQFITAIVKWVAPEFFQRRPRKGKLAIYCFSLCIIGIRREISIFIEYIKYTFQMPF